MFRMVNLFTFKVLYAIRVKEIYRSRLLIDVQMFTDIYIFYRLKLEKRSLITRTIRDIK